MRPAAWPEDPLFAPNLPPVAILRHLLPEVAPHTHGFAEIAVLIAGEAMHVDAEGERMLRAGAGALLPIGAWHGWRRCRGAEVIDICLGPAALRGPLAWTRREPALAALVERLDPQAAAMPRPTVLALAPALPTLTALADPAPRAATLVAAALATLDAVAPLLPPAAAAAEAPAVVAEAMRRLAADPARAWTLAGLAAALRIDRSYLIRRFRTYAGLPPMAWLERTRAERAAELLTTTTWPVARVAAAVGWPASDHFARRFRRHHGMTPGAWRELAG